MTSTPQSALLIGGGIGGTAAALALARLGIQVDLLEQSPVIGEIGAGLQLGPNAFAALDALGVGEEVRRKAVFTDSLVLMDAVNCAEVVNVPVGEAFRNRFKNPYAVSHRADLQMKMREQGRPWEIGKAFDFSGPIGPVRRKAETGEVHAGAIGLTVNGQTRQSSDLKHLIWSVNEIIANLSTLFALQPGDVIFTGTPDGVGAVQRGDSISTTIAGFDTLNVRIV